MRQFAHLHLHTQYSLLDGANKIPDVLEHAHKLGQPAIAMTDHGNVHGAIEFYKEAKRIGIKPIIGCELYVTTGSRFDKRPKEQGGAPTHHLTVLVQDLAGYRNLCKLVSLAYKEGFYFKPRVDHELLRGLSGGLIALSGCLAGEFAGAVEVDNERAARALVEEYSEIFGDRFYFEVQPHQIPEQRKLNQACAEFAKAMGIPLVATTDCHYANKEDHFAQEVLMCVSTGKQVSDPDHIKHEGFTLHLKSGDEMFEEFGGLPYADEALRCSVEISTRCSLEFKFDTYYMPAYPLSPSEAAIAGIEVEKDGAPRSDTDPKALIAVMAARAREGLTRRLDLIAEQATKTGTSFSTADRTRYAERLELEIRLIGKMGFAGYFLVVSDFIVWAKEHGVPVGPGRGSAAGSLVAYAMRITDIDPITHKLLFERFLNPDRVSLPDIDVDFCILGRDRVIEYVSKKYGSDRVAQIATFGTLKAKAAIKDVGRALGIGYAETDRVAQLVPAPRQGFDYPLAEALKLEPRLKEYAEGEGKELISLALKLEGLTRHASTHAAGVVIGDRPLMELLPMMVDKDGKDVTQFDMSSVEKAGLVKFDFLGLKTLTVVHTAIALIKESRNITIDLETLPLEDKKAYALLCAGNTTGVFQLESGGITEMTVRLKPNCFDDLVAILALYRPGPLDAGMVDHYINRKHGKEAVTYMHPRMKDVLADTYGIMLYQEQIMQLARELAGYSLGEADLLRKAMGKKIPEEMAKHRERFVKGAHELGIEDRHSNSIFDQMETFARYGFNRSHSAAYAMISFHTAYLKAHFPVEFLAALMTHDADDTDKVLKNLNECRKQRIAVLPPAVNESLAGFSVEQGKIRFGLGAVKGIGEKAVQSIREARERGGRFIDLEDFAARVDLQAVNRRVFESLVKSGAFDASGASRREMIERLDEVLKFAQASQRKDDVNQVSLFGGVGAPAAKMPRRSVKLPEWPVNQRLAFEREALGFYISGHPLEKFREDLKRFGVLTTSDVKSKKGGGRQAPELRVAGVVTALKLKNTKKGDRYASFVLEDYLGTVEALVWPDTYREYSRFMVADDPVIVTARPDITDERAVIIISKMESLTELRDRRATQGFLALKEEDDFEARIERLLGIFQKHSGKCPVKVKLHIEGAEVSMQLKDRKDSPVCVVPSEQLCDQVEELFGRPVLSFV